MHAGGAERVLSILANSWARKGRDVVLVTTHDNGNPSFYPLDENIKQRPICLDDIPGGGKLANLKRVRALRGLVQEESPALVVSFLNFTNVLVLLACWGLHVPVIVSERQDPRVNRLGLFWNYLRRVTYPRAAILVNQTEAAASWFRGWMRDKICIIPNPVMEPALGNEPPEIVLESPSLVAMGRLVPQKGFGTLLQAMGIVHKQRPELKLTILGEGDHRLELEELRKELGLGDVVSLPGKVKNPYRVLLQAEAFILSSVTEGFPNVLCEAMAVGLPVISTNCPSGPDEIIIDGENGLLVPVGNAQALAKAILKLGEDEEARIAMGAEAQAVVGRFSLDSILEAWEQVLARTSP